MPYSTVAKNRMLDALARGVAPPVAGIDSLSLHTDTPGETGANEVAGGAPAYARKTPTWNAPSAGSVDDSTNPAPVFDIPAGTTLKFVGLWSAGTWMGSAVITPNETFAAQGTYTLTDLDLDLNL